MPDRPRHSRFRRLPGLYRIGEKKPADPHAEPQLLSLYLPGRTLDQAEELAIRAGGGSVQAYCERTLSQAIEAEDRRVHDHEAEVRRNPLRSLDAMADPEYLAEWNASAVARHEAEPAVPLAAEVGAGRPAAAWSREVVLRHAAMGAVDPFALLPSLRTGASVPAEAADELLAALADLESRLGPSDPIDRRLAYALHRLAFEGQVLLTDAYPARAADATTEGLLRQVQEAVDRVLSGEDIRYYPDESGREGRP